MHGIRDRRTSLRVEVEGEAVVYTDRDVIEGRCLDLGREGIAIRSTRATRAKTPVTLELYLHGQRLRVEAVLIRRKRHQGDYIMGFRFTEVDRQTSTAIDHVIFGRLAASPHADMFLAFAAHHAATGGQGYVHGPTPTPGPSIDTSDPPLVPVISGLTQIVSIDQLERPPIVDRTVIAPPPQRTDTVRSGLEPAQPRPAAEDSGAPEEEWFDDEMDTSELRLLAAAAAADTDLALDSEPDASPPDDTAVVTYADEPVDTVEDTALVANEPVATVDHTEIVVTTDEPIDTVDHTEIVATTDEPVATVDHTEIVVTTDEPIDTIDHTEIVVTTDEPIAPIEDTAIVASANEPVDTVDHTEVVSTAIAPSGSPSDSTVVVTAPTEPPGQTADASSDPTGVPEPVAATRSSTMALPVDETPEGPRTATIPLLPSEPSPEGPRTATIPLLAPEDLRAPEGPRTATVPLLAPSAASPRLSPAVVDATAPPPPPSTPTQRALHDAMALLRPSSPPRRRGPRVIVSVPHQTYRRQIALPWNR